MESIDTIVNQNSKQQKVQKPLMMLEASIFWLPKRSYFIKHISYLMKRKIPSSWIRSARPHLILDIGGHVRWESIVKGCSKAISLAGENGFRRMHAGREWAHSGFTAVAHKEHYATNPVCPLFVKSSWTEYLFFIWTSQHGQWKR